MSQYLVDRIESMPDEIDRAARHGGPRGARREPAGGDHDRRGRRRCRAFPPRRCSSSSAPSRTPTGSATRRRARSAGSSSPGEQVLDVPKGCPPWPLKSGAVRARDEHPRRLRRRRRPRPVDQARRLRGRRGLDGRAARPQVPQGLVTPWSPASSAGSRCSPTCPTSGSRSSRATAPSGRSRSASTSSAGARRPTFVVAPARGRARDDGRRRRRRAAVSPPRPRRLPRAISLLTGERLRGSTRAATRARMFLVEPEAFRHAARRRTGGVQGRDERLRPGRHGCHGDRARPRPVALARARSRQGSHTS